MQVHIFYAPAGLGGTAQPLFRSPTFSLKPHKSATFEILGLSEAEVASAPQRDPGCVWSRHEQLSGRGNCSREQLLAR